MPTVVALDEIDGEPKRRRVVFEGAEAIEIAYESALAAGLLPGRTVDAGAISEAVSDDAARVAERQALSLLSRRNLSESELRKKLVPSPPAIIDRIVEKCIEWGYLDDKRLAEAIVHDGIELKHHGPARLRRTLRERGIDRDLADEALASSAVDQPSAVEQAMAALSSKRRSYARLEPEVAKRRMMGFLQRRGFDFGTIKEAVREFIDGSTDDVD